MENLLNKDYNNFIGTDESGTGSFFGGIVSTSVYIPEENYIEVVKLGITDSKKMSDKKILSIYKYLLNLVDSESYVMTPLHYNFLNKSYNLNELKTIIHMNTIGKLITKIGVKNSGILLDDYCGNKNFDKYVVKCGLDNIYNSLNTSITFEQKAELKSLSVACASVIARYLFLENIEQIKNNYNLKDLPKGVDDKAVLVGKDLVDSYGKDVLEETCKLNFKTVNKIIQSKD